MKSVVAIDLRTSSQGAINLAAWVKGQAPSLSMVGVHVVEGSPEDRDGFIEPAKQATERVLEVTEARNALSEVIVEAADDVATCLLAVKERTNADCVMIGREGLSSEPPFERLGEIARAVLEQSNAPVIVARPDLARASMPSGPVIVATDLTDDSVGALTFARELAKQLNRDLIVGHVARHFDHPPIYLPTADWTVGAATRQDEASKRTGAWVQAHGGPARMIVDEGPVVRRILGMAGVEDACVVVCGSRQAGGKNSSVTGMELAATARVPVAIVPGTWTPS